MKKLAAPALALLAVSLVTLLVPTVSCCAVLAQQKFLQGGVEHAEQLQSAINSLKVGTQYDEAKFAKLTPIRIWYRVPPWMAGKWQYDEETQTFYQDYATGASDEQTYHSQAHNTSSFANQRDRLGGLWDYIDAPYVSETTTDKVINKDLHTDESIIFDSDAKLIMRSVVTRTSLDKTTKIISKVYRMEQFTTYFPYGPNAVRAEYSFKTLDQGGKPINLTKTWAIGRKLAPSTVGNSDPSFAAYLKSQGLENLVPLPM
jgi:hypothetical protein